mgnify:FL=1
MVHGILDGTLLRFDRPGANDVHPLDPCYAFDGALLDVEEFADSLNIIHKRLIHPPVGLLDLAIRDGEDELVLTFEVDGDEDHHDQDDCCENQNGVHHPIVQVQLAGVKSRSACWQGDDKWVQNIFRAFPAIHLQLPYQRAW